MISPAKLETRSVVPMPLHDEIAQCARELWSQSGRPQGHDEAIWLEAERRLIAARRDLASVVPPSIRSRLRSRVRTARLAPGKLLCVL
jgi:hypothetical protein